MDLFGRDDLNTLVDARDSVCVSIYLPTFRKGHETQQNRIRFKNLLGEAEEMLGRMEGSEGSKGLLVPAKALLEDPFFWLHQSDGLSAFVARDFFRTYRLPIDFQDMVGIAGRFHVKPILPLFFNDARVYILAFSQNDVRLFQSSRQWVREVYPEHLPKRLSEALRYDETEQQLQFHTRTAGASTGATGRRPGMFHGHGGTSAESKDRIVRYFREIDRGLQEVLRDERAPLILAGVEYLFSLYREANTYQHLLEEGIAGNPEEVSAEELHRRAWEIVGPLLEKGRKDALDKYGNLAGTGRTSDDLKEILAAAHRGRVDVLFAPSGVAVWGKFDVDSEAATLHDEKEPGDEDLLDLAVVQTIGRGGTVYMVPPEETPNRSQAAAVFRY